MTRVQTGTLCEYCRMASWIPLEAHRRQQQCCRHQHCPTRGHHGPQLPQWLQLLEALGKRLEDTWHQQCRRRPAADDSNDGQSGSDLEDGSDPDLGWSLDFLVERLLVLGRIYAGDTPRSLLPADRRGAITGLLRQLELLQPLLPALDDCRDDAPGDSGTAAAVAGTDAAVFAEAAAAAATTVRGALAASRRDGSPLQKRGWFELLLQECRQLFSTVSTAGGGPMGRAGDVDVVLVDEAAQLVEAETAIVLNRWVRGSQVGIGQVSGAEGRERREVCFDCGVE